MHCCTIILDHTVCLQLSKDRLISSSASNKFLLPLTYDEAIALRDDLNYCIDVLKPKTLKQSLYPTIGD